MFSNLDIIMRLIAAVVLGGVIGIERERHGRAAGFRTHILVCVGAALIMLTSMYIYEIYRSSIAVDPARIAAGVVTGIGFLCAGTIMRSGNSVVGLTTAASIWAAAAIGLAVGCGFYLGAFFTTGLVYVTLFLFGKIGHTLVKR